MTAGRWLCWVENPDLEQAAQLHTTEKQGVRRRGQAGARQRRPPRQIRNVNLLDDGVKLTKKQDWGPRLGCRGLDGEREGLDAGNWRRRRAATHPKHERRAGRTKGRSAQPFRANGRQSLIHTACTL